MEKYFAQWLCSIPGIGNAAMRRIKQACGSLEGALDASEEALTKILTKRQLGALLEGRRGIDSRERLTERFLELNRRGILFTCHGEPDYPVKLMEIPDSPVGLYYRGKLPAEGLSVAVVGARDCSAYGARVAEELGRYLGEQGVQVISGMARGIDGISQAAALSAGGSSFAVLGSGVDVCYPASNRELYERLLERGGILSSYPPGTAPVSTNFPPRNRIVSGLADAVVVVEARDRSGTLTTVDMALEQGREVYVAPGRITDRLSDGCNRLLRQGAGVFLSPGDFLSEIQPVPGTKAGQRTSEAGRQTDAAGQGTPEAGQQTDAVWQGTPEAVRRTDAVWQGMPEAVRRTDAAGQGTSEAGQRTGVVWQGTSEALRRTTGLGRWTSETGREKAAVQRAAVREDGRAGRVRRTMSPELEEIYLALDDTPASLEKIAARTQGGLSPVQVNTMLLRLCVEGLAVQVSPGYFCRRSV